LSAPASVERRKSALLSLKIGEQITHCDDNGSNMIARDLIFDLGMHRGEDTDFYLRMGYRVVGIEADPDNAACCRQRFSDQIARQQVRVIEGAVAPDGASSKIRFFKNADLDFWGTVDPSFVERNLQLGTKSVEIEVEPINLREVMRDFGTPWYLKSDIQGSDWIVLQALATTTDRPTFISINAEKVSFDRLVSEVDSLVRLGYPKLQVIQQQFIPGSAVEAISLDGHKFRYVFEDGASGQFGDELPDHWLDRDAILRDYAGIFRQYRWFGDQSTMVKIGARRLLRLMGRIIGRPLPGWHDIHARLAQ
jgi:FkbM family methyltransferase